MPHEKILITSLIYLQKKPLEQLLKISSGEPFLLLGLDMA